MGKLLQLKGMAVTGLAISKVCFGTARLGVPKARWFGSAKGALVIRATGVSCQETAAISLVRGQTERLNCAVITAASIFDAAAMPAGLGLPF